MRRIIILVMGVFLVTGCSTSGRYEQEAKLSPSAPVTIGLAQVQSPEQMPSGSVSAAGPAEVVAEAAGKKVVRPPQAASWQVQYSGDPLLEGARIMNVDGVDTSAITVSHIHSSGAYAICYFNAGAYEDWRADVNKFPKNLLGKNMAGWEGEKWLDIRNLDALMPIMKDRIDECAKKGFNAIDPDNVDGWVNDTGFPLSKGDSARYIKALADAAHAKGLAIGLKNAVGLIPDLVDKVDFAVNEECVAKGECNLYQPFLDRGKAVLHVEYEGGLKSICAKRPAGFSTVRKNMELDSKRESC